MSTKPPRHRVIIARFILFMVYYASFAWFFRHGGESWLVTFAAPIVYLTILAALGWLFSLVWCAAFGLPFPWEVKSDVAEH